MVARVTRHTDSAFFYFKQKAAIEVRISDWSSDVVLFRSSPDGRGRVCASPRSRRQAETAAARRTGRAPPTGPATAPAAAAPAPAQAGTTYRNRSAADAIRYAAASRSRPTAAPRT